MNQLCVVSTFFLFAHRSGERDYRKVPPTAPMRIDEDKDL
jgi:hypothetical protein